MRTYESHTDEDLEALVNKLDAQRLAVRDEMLHVQAELTLRSRVRALDRLNLPSAARAQVIQALAVESAVAVGTPGAE